MTNNRSRKFLADSLATAVFWTIIYTPIFLYTSKSLDLALVGLGTSAVVEIAFGGLYGRFLDWFRKFWIPK
ncbi:MAG: L-alanine exporter AlaE [Candidatus Bathyarchaeia archaeon]